MSKGKLIVAKTNKGSTYVQLDRLNGRPPMSLSYVSFKDATFDGKECEYGFENGKVTFIEVDGKRVYPMASVVQIPKSNAHAQNNNATGGTSHPKNNSNNIFPDSFNIKDTQLPKDVWELPIGDIDNFYLKLNKAGRYLENKREGKREGKFYFFKNDFRCDRAGKESGHKFLINPNYGSLKFDQLVSRLERQSECFSNKKILKFSPDWRLIAGIGGASIYEVGMTLHHVYGIPYIPASSIKGLVRSWMIQSIWGNNEDSEALAFHESKLMCDIFGCQEKIEYGKDKPKKFKVTYYKIHHKTITEQQGNVYFFDAFPMSPPKIEPDIMNVHYPKYYGEGQAPTDTQSPIPIPFLTVGNKDLNGNALSFKSFIGMNASIKLLEYATEAKSREIFENLSTDNTILDLVERWLQKALSEHGIGAKTAVGYGYMNSVK